MADITVIILTYNEEKNIEDCIRSVKDAAKRIVVVDSFSSDRTEEMARSLGAEFVQHEFIDQAKQFIYALDNIDISTKWVLRLDADERLTREALDEIERVCRENEDTDINGFDVYFTVNFLGRDLKHYPFHKLILFKKGKAHMEDRSMDEHIVLDEGRSGVLKSLCIHNDHNGLTAWIDKHNKYSDREVLNMQGGDEDVEFKSLSRMTGIKRFVKYRVYYRLPAGLRSYLYYLYRLYIKGGILDGKEGRIFAFLQAYWYRYLVDAKLYEKRKDK